MMSELMELNGFKIGDIVSAKPEGQRTESWVERKRYQQRKIENLEIEEFIKNWGSKKLDCFVPKNSIHVWPLQDFVKVNQENDQLNEIRVW